MVLFLGLLVLGGCGQDPPAAVVAVRAAGCGAVPADGVGTIVATGRVLTAAHTVAGAESITVDGAPAELVELDPANDLAVLRIGDRLTAPLPSGTATPRRGTSAGAYVTRAGQVRRIDVTIVRPVVIATTDIYGDARTERPGFELAGPIVPGDSGAPVVVDGYLVGVVWARSHVAPGRAYATAVTAHQPDRTADTTRCAG